jgi:effector-binding domain-containing protein
VEIERSEEPTRHVLVVRQRVPIDELPAFFGEAFGRCVEAAQSRGLEIGGVPFAWYFGQPTDSIEVAAGLPVDHPGTDLPDGVIATERPGGEAAVAVHVGPYDTIEGTYRQVEEWVGEHELTPRDDMWEEYLTDPGLEPDQSKWETRIVIPLTTS